MATADCEKRLCKAFMFFFLAFSSENQLNAGAHDEKHRHKFAWPNTSYLT